jgi:hypothetical protein
MPCDSRPIRRNQTLEERIGEVRRVVLGLDRALLRRQVKAVVGPQGSITFAGMVEGKSWEALKAENGVSDACVYRLLMVSGSSIAKAEIARAEALAGRSVNRQAVNAGVHSHDGGVTWNEKG